MKTYYMLVLGVPRIRLEGFQGRKMRIYFKKQNLYEKYF